VTQRCLSCGSTVTVPEATTERVDGSVITVLVCPDCRSSRLVADSVRLRAGVTTDEVSAP